MEGDEGRRFLIDFEALKSATEDNPEILEDIWHDRVDLQELCDRLHDYSFRFSVAEEWTPFSFTPHVPAGASKARRDFDLRWREIVAIVADRKFRLHEIFANWFADLENDVNEEVQDVLGSQIDAWKRHGKEDADNVRYAFSYLSDTRDDDEYDDFDWVDDTLLSWDRLEKFVGVDLDNAFWRRRAIPHILFPSHVSAHYGATKASVYHRLLDAARAFTFGAPLAALAMQRAVMEEVLKRHWGAEKGLIRDAGLPELPWGISADKLKKLANAALHGDQGDFSPDKLERQIVKNFQFLRVLIEHAPEDLEGHKRQKS